MERPRSRVRGRRPSAGGAVDHDPDGCQQGAEAEDEDQSPAGVGEEAQGTALLEDAALALAKAEGRGGDLFVRGLLRRVVLDGGGGPGLGHAGLAGPEGVAGGERLAVILREGAEVHDVQAVLAGEQVHVGGRLGAWATPPKIATGSGCTEPSGLTVTS